MQSASDVSSSRRRRAIVTLWLATINWPPINMKRTSQTRLPLRPGRRPQGGPVLPGLARHKHQTPWKKEENGRVMHETAYRCSVLGGIHELYLIVCISQVVLGKMVCVSLLLQCRHSAGGRYSSTATQCSLFGPALSLGSCSWNLRVTIKSISLHFRIKDI